MVRSPLVRKMLEQVLAEPILLYRRRTYLHGHYLAYLLSGSRRRGLFLRRPLEPRNSDRAVLLAVTYAIFADSNDEAIGEAAALLDQRIEVRDVSFPDRRRQIPHLPRKSGQAQGLPPYPQGNRLTESAVRSKEDARHAGRPQSRIDASKTRRS